MTAQGIPPMSDASGTLRWGHININVADLERSIRFYERLGFETFIPGIPYLCLARDRGLESIPDESARALGLTSGTRGRACIMQLDDGFPKIDLTELDVASQAPPLGNADLGLVRLCLVSGDLQADYDRLTAEGVRFLSPPQQARGGLADIATCVDPDGTLIELLQVHLEKWPSLPSPD